ncbi:MAG TPA: hypothetical protein VIR03_03135 [Candidatus Saccharimonadales bacterium]
MVGYVRTHSQRFVIWLVLAMFTLLVPAAIVVPTHAHAAQLQQRSLTMGSIAPNATTTHTFRFAYTTMSTAVGSLVIEYCTSPLLDVVCVAPQGVNAAGATLTDQQGERGYFLLTAQTNRFILTRAPSSVPRINPSQYTFSNVVNPNFEGTFYARITTYVSTNGSGTYTDFGAVAQATSSGQMISTEVPPYLNFCVGLIITGDCSTAAGYLIDLGTLSPSHASYGTSQMLAATNGNYGLIVGMYGTTMTSGNNIIAALAHPTASAPGNSQFGINLRANSDPSVGQEPSGGGIVAPTASYNTSNKYMFAANDTIAASPSATDTKKLTASYVVNVSPDQAPGVYTATLTYICTASF